MPGLELTHDTGRPVSTAPLASRNVATSACTPPTIKLKMPGLTLTVATGAVGTVTLAVPATPSAVAVIIALPGATADTTPALEMDATAVFPLLHTTSRDARFAPRASRTVAEKRTGAPPTDSDAVAGVTLTEPTATRGITGFVASAPPAAVQPPMIRKSTTANEARQKPATLPEEISSSVMYGGIASMG